MNLQQITIQPFHTSSQSDTYLMEAEDRFFEIGRDAAELLTYLKEHGTGDESIEQYVSDNGGRPTKEEIKAFVDSLTKKTSATDGEKDKRKSFIYNKDFIAADVLGHYTSPLSNLFRPWVMAVLVCLFAALDTTYFMFFNKQHGSAEINIYILACMYIFLIMSSLFHEFGHAAACRHYGATHGNIGLGLYLNLPVFYTDVSHVWKLSRRQRCVVNFGGIYFQMLLLIPILAAAIATGSNLLRYMIVLVNLNFLITMNPFFKFDGYWMVTDITGVANLRKKGSEWMAYAWRRLRGKDTAARPYLLSLSLWARYTMMGYTMVVSLFFGFYFFYMIPMFFVRFYYTFPDRLRTLLAELSMHRMPEWNNMQQIALQLMFLFLFSYMLYRTIIPLLKRITLWIRQSVQRAA